MSTNARPLKGYVRFDGQGRIIPGSLILRKKKPALGTWKEVPAYECCNSVTVSSVVADVELIIAGLNLYCNGTLIGTYSTGSVTAGINDVAQVLTDVFGMLGSFVAVGEDTIKFTMSLEQKTALCPVGTLSFTITDY
jgi:hypothetical protein